MSKVKEFEKKFEEYADVAKKILVWAVSGVVIFVVAGFAVYSVFKIIFG